MKEVKRKLAKDVVRQTQDHTAKLPKGKLRAVLLEPMKGVRYLPIKAFKKMGKKPDIICGDPPGRRQGGQALNVDKFSGRCG